MTDATVVFYPVRPRRRFPTLYALWIILAAGLACGAWFRVDKLVEWHNGAPPAAENDELAALYRQLAACGHIKVDSDGLLTMPPADYGVVAMAQAAAEGRPSPDNDPAWRRCAELLDARYRSRVGVTLGKQIDRYNASQGLLAVRDDRPRQTDQTVVANSPVLPGDRPGQWNAAFDDRPVAPLDVPVPEIFRYVAATPRPGFGDWSVYDYAHPSLRLETTLSLAAPAIVTVQVIGRIDAARSSLPKGARIVARCAKPPCDQTAAATEIMMNLSAGRHDVAIQATPTAHKGLPAPDLALKPARDGELPVWGVGMRHPGRRPPPPRGPLTILSADGVTLWREDLANDVKGRPTQAAIEAGLLPLLGFGADDADGVAGVLARRPNSHEALTVALTIDMRVQRAAQTALTARLAALFSPDKDPYRNDRRAALTIVDPAAGAILALVGHPAAPTDLHAWDYAAGRAANRRRDPLAVYGHQGRTGDMAPGSTFKLVDAVAGLMAAATDPTLAAMIAGCDRKGDTLACANLNVTHGYYRMEGQTGVVRNFKRQNDRYETIAEGLREPLRDPACAAEPPARAAHYGMAEALRDSLNQWFVKLAERIDYAPAAAYDHAARRRKTRDFAALPDLNGARLLATMDALGLFTPLDLAGGARSRLGNANAGGGALTAEPAQSDLRDLSDPAVKKHRTSGAIDALAQTAVGQRLQIPALRMTGVVAAIAADGKVAPLHLFASWNGEALAETAATVIPVDMSPIRAGMKSVVEVGTAANAFSATSPLKMAKCNVYGKTGTAEIRTGEPESGGKARPHVNSAWFVGWAEAQAFEALRAPGAEVGGWRAPLAFGCYISHAYGDARFGGTSCARVTADFLQLVANPSASIAGKEAN